MLTTLFQSIRKKIDSITAMEVSKTQFVMMTDIEKMTYPENQPGVAGVWEKVSGNLVTIPSFIKNNFKSIFGKTAFYKIILLSNLLFLLGIFKTQAQQNDNYALYANIIYRVTKYVNWPDDKKSGDFVIGIVGDSPLYDEIKSFTGNKTVGNQRIVIKTFSSSAASYNCQILFISENESHSLKKIAKVTGGTPTLLISEFNGLANKGSCINFIIVGEHLKLEINKNNMEQRNLDVASEFLVLGTIVK